MIDVQHVSKIYKASWLRGGTKFVALDEFNFQAQPFEITGLIGANGAGKTTLFRLIGGMEVIDKGNIIVNGLSIKDHPERTRGKVSLLLEKHNFMGMIGHNILVETGLMMGLEGKDAITRAEQLTQELNMEDFIMRRAQTYSRGQSGRMAIARMNMSPSPVLIFDEPTVGLDFDSADVVRRFIKQKATEGHTVVLATHILRDIELLCDKTFGIEKGKNVDQETLHHWMERAKMTSIVSLNGDCSGQ